MLIKKMWKLISHHTCLLQRIRCALPDDLAVAHDLESGRDAHGEVEFLFDEQE